MSQIEFFYDFGSPNAYLSHKVLPGFATRHAAKLSWHPILLGGVFKATNNQSPMQSFAGVAGKLAHQRREIARFVERYDIPFHFNPHFPINTLNLMRGAVFAQGKTWERLYVDTVFDALWVDGHNMADPVVIGEVLSRAGLPAADIMAATQTPEVKQALIETTDAAVARGIYGAPSMFVGDEMFFGKDCLDEMAWVLGRR